VVRVRGGVHGMIAGLVFRSVLIVVVFAGSILLIVSGYFFSGLLLHAGLVAWLLAGTLNPSSRLFGPIQTHCENGIWLTLDDGPDPKTTPVILNLLDSHCAKATFFVIGERAEAYPQLILDIQKRGHQVANHTYTHPQASFWCHGPIRTYREIARCQQVLKKITGKAPLLFRAPVGHHNVFVHPVLRYFGMRLIGWDSRGFDAAPGATLESVTARIRASARDGSIILAHESTPYAEEVISDILAMAQENGWVFRLSDVSPKS